MNYAPRSPGDLQPEYPDEALSAARVGTGPCTADGIVAGVQSASPAKGEASLTTLCEPQYYDRKSSFADKLDRYTDSPEFRMIAGWLGTFVTRGSPALSSIIFTRWILYNGDQRVAAFALPPPCRLSRDSSRLSVMAV